MRRLKLHYSDGLLTAAQYHGAAHQRPQEFQKNGAPLPRASCASTASKECPGSPMLSASRFEAGGCAKPADRT
jgi:hypothetical protein